MSVGQLQVSAESLSAAAGVLATAVDAAASAVDAVAGAAGRAGAFGGEPPGAAFSDACHDALRALAELRDTVAELSANVGAAATGYVTTDEGVVPAGALFDFDRRAVP